MIHSLCNKLILRVKVATCNTVITRFWGSHSSVGDREFNLPATSTRAHYSAQHYHFHTLTSSNNSTQKLLISCNKEIVNEVSLHHSPESTHVTFGVICPRCSPSWSGLLSTVVCYTTFQIFERITAKHNKLISQITLWNVADFCVSHRTCVTRGPYTVSTSPPLEAMTRCHMTTSSGILLS